MPQSEQKTQSSIQSGNLVQLLKVLSREEIKEFGKFVNSPFHNNRKDLIQFFEEIKVFYPDFNQTEFSK
ncbi:MAG: hypothetical protein J0M18_21530, partial [Ignavibacteria bacterium]|nr:hypothetical protein [Ignavibacteria bacterium]